MFRWVSMVTLAATVLISCGGAGGSAVVPSGGSSESTGDHEQAFLATCEKEGPGRESFCSCRWAWTVGVSREDDLAGTSPAHRLGEIDRGSRVACVDKAPEADQGAEFAKYCAADQPDRTEGCRCVWTAARAKRSAADIAASIREDNGAFRLYVQEKNACPAQAGEDRLHLARSRCEAALPEQGAYCACVPDMMSRMGWSVERAMEECSSKMNGSLFHERFARGCAKGSAELAPFCDCLWRSFGQSLSGAQISVDTNDGQAMSLANPRGREVAQSCASTLSEPAARAVFMSQCADVPERSAYCACAWQEVRGRLGLEAVMTTRDLLASSAYDAIAPAIDTRCGALPH